MRKPPFIEYFIKRENSLPLRGEEIKFIIANRAGRRKARIGRWSGYLRAIPIIDIFKKGRAIFLVKRKDTGKHEPWLEDYRLQPNPDWYLMGVLNRERAVRAETWRRAQE